MGIAYSYEEYLQSVKECGYNLKYVPEHLRDRKICFAAVKSYGLAIEHVPHSVLNYTMCLLAVKHHAHAIVYIPLDFFESMSSDEKYNICIEAMKTNYCPWMCMEYIATNFKASLGNDFDKVCLQAVKTNGNYLKYVKGQVNLTNREEVCLEAVKNTHEAFKYIEDLNTLKNKNEVIQEATINLLRNGNGNRSYVSDLEEENSDSDTYED